MDSLLQVMAAKKRELAQIREETVGEKKLKYMRRAEVESMRYAQEKQQQELTNRRHNDEDEEKTKPLLQVDSTSTHEEEEVLPWNELKRQLRELGEPISLFGETDHARMSRLREAEHRAATRHEDAMGDDHSTGYDFVHGSDEERGDPNELNDDGFADDHTSQRRSKRSAFTEDGDDEDEMMLVYRFFKGMLRRWEQDLAERPDHIKRTAQGKMATKTMKQCKDYIRPLFKLCKKREVSQDILPNLVQIVKFCKEGEFVQANDAYIKLAIGNAAWPIGVTMVGIHERTGREKINANKQAHVMNNEAQRKYITSVKRLISYAQSVANVLPSKRVS